MENFSQIFLDKLRIIVYNRIKKISKIGEMCMNKGERIKYLREKNEISQDELAFMLKISKQAISKYENGIVTNIPSDKIEQMANIFNVSPAYIMGWEKSDIEELTNLTSYEKMNNNVIGQNIQHFRNAIGMSQEELAKMCGYVDRSSISKIEKGERGIDSSKLVQIAKVLKTTPQELLGWETEMTNAKKLTSHEQDVISAYRRLDDSQKVMVDRLLCIPSENEGKTISEALNDVLQVGEHIGGNVNSKTK